MAKINKDNLKIGVTFTKCSECERVPVVYGEWIVENEFSIRCSVCCFNRAEIKMPLDYCPSCGANMWKKVSE